MTSRSYGWTLGCRRLGGQDASTFGALDLRIPDRLNRAAARLYRSSATSPTLVARRRLVRVPYLSPDGMPPERQAYRPAPLWWVTRGRDSEAS